MYKKIQNYIHAISQSFLNNFLDTYEPLKFQRVYYLEL